MGKPTAHLCEVVDVEGRLVEAEARLVDAERRLGEAEARYQALTEDLPDVVFAADLDGRLTHLNPSFERQTGIPAAAAIGLHVLDLVQPEERPHAAAVLDDLWRGALPAGRFEGRYHSAVLGGLAWFEVLICVMGDDEDRAVGITGVIRDVTDRKEAEAALDHRARHDELTGLLNRAAVIDRLDLALSTAASGHVAVLFVDLDGFKEVNDSHGHDAGDVLLTEVGERLREALGEGEIAGRVGGDEFVVVSEGHASAGQALEVADRLRAALSEERRPISASIGAAVGQGGTGVGVGELLRSADLSMYQAKSKRRLAPTASGRRAIRVLVG